MTSPATATPRSERDGCGCPPDWLEATFRMVRCAHFEGASIWLFERTDCRVPFGMMLQGTCFRGLYGSYSFDSEADGIAAFHAYEENLLCGDA